MSILVGQNHPRSEQSFIPEGYSSKICRLFVQGCRRNPESQILDLGPVCGENIEFFGSRVKRLFVCDMFSRLHRCRKAKGSVAKIWNVLDYPRESFDGILLWDLVDRLASKETENLVRVCQRLIKPKGMIMLTSFSRQIFLPDVNTFIVKNNFDVSFRPQHHLKLYVTYRTNREIMTMFSLLSPVKAQLNKNGFREFLLQRPAG